MTRDTRLGVAAVLLLSVLPAPSTAAQPAAAGDEIDRFVAQRMRSHLIPGLAVVVISDGVVVHRQGFGNLGPADPILIGSLSKAFTATAVLQLVDAGRIRLDEPVRTYLPELALGDPAAAAITVRHLLNQTSGLPTSAARAAARDAPLADHVAALAGVSLAARPGERHIYSSPNYQVLGRLVEVVSGQSFGDYVSTHLFEALGMTSSGVEPTQVPPAAGHNLWWGVAGPSFYRFERGRLPTASLIASADDLARFALAHLGVMPEGGPPLLSAAALAEAHRGVADGGGFRYAMGWRDGPTAGAPSLWHGGALPSYRGAMVLLPQLRSAVVVTSNVSTLFADSTREIAAGVVALLQGKPVPEVGSSLRRVYLMIAGASLLVLGSQLWSLVRAAKWREPPRRSAIRVLLLDLALPMALVVLLPRLVRVSWRGVFEAAPDIALTTVVVSALAITTGLLRLRRLRATRE
jgi:CubicO group peptidase (beta-lactamase class C family)